jgi:two-component system, NarL family, invasion response regulator UvrY
MIRIMLVDDHAVVREGYRRLIEKHAGMTVVAEAADGADAYVQYKRHKPDIVVLDLSMPGQGGIEALRHLRQWDEHAKILVFTMHENAAYAVQAIQAGAKGYITKSSPPALLIDAIRDVADGKRPISRDMSDALAISRLDGERGVLDGLTAREFDIFRMLAEAKSVDEIATTLNLSTKTVANYHYIIKSKLSVSSDVELVHLAIKYRIIHAA